MIAYMYSDEQYDYYGSKMNKPYQNRTKITARDSNGKITFHSESKGRLNRPAINKILKAWGVNPDKEQVEYFYI